MNESYTINIQSPVSTLSADNVFGALRGLETFSQLVYGFGNNYYINPWTIADQPRFAWRGLLIDTSRHFLPVNTILRILDGMAYEKLNVLHWHVVDGQSFPIYSETYPLLTQFGAYNALFVYSHSDVQNIIQYANLRGIRVLPEFDMPTHANSWGAGYPYLVMNCSMFDSVCQPPPNAPHNYTDICCDNPMDPTDPITYDFIRGFLTEMTGLFVDNFLHLGGDELSYRVQCWNVTRINDWMKQNGITDYYKLEGYFVAQAQKIGVNLNRNIINWQDLFNSNVTLLPGTVIQIWKDHKTLDDVTAAGFRSTFSFGWYLNHLDYTWQSMYQNEPFDQTMTPTQQALVLGGEACIWGEMVDETNIEATIWPRIAAVSERLWSPITVTNITDAGFRLHDHRCRLRFRGVLAAPLGPGWCY